MAPTSDYEHNNATAPPPLNPAGETMGFVIESVEDRTLKEEFGEIPLAPDCSIQILIQPTLFRQVVEQAFAAAPPQVSVQERKETGGIFAGRQTPLPGGRFLVQVEEYLPVGDGNLTEFSITLQDWANAAQELRRRGGESRGLSLVGVYHSHPGHGVFHSGMDKIALGVEGGILTQPWQFSLVIDHLTHTPRNPYGNAGIFFNNVQKADFGLQEPFPHLPGLFGNPASAEPLALAPPPAAPAYPTLAPAQIASAGASPKSAPAPYAAPRPPSVTGAASAPYTGVPIPNAGQNKSGLKLPLKMPAKIVLIAAPLMLLLLFIVKPMIWPSKPTGQGGTGDPNSPKNASTAVNMKISMPDTTDSFSKIVCTLDTLTPEREKNLEASDSPWKIVYTDGSNTPHQLEYDAEKIDAGKWQLTPASKNSDVDPGTYQASVHALLKDGTEVAVSKAQAFTVQEDIGSPGFKVTVSHHGNAQNTRYTFQMRWSQPANSKRSDWKYFLYQRIYPNLASENIDTNFPAGTDPMEVKGTSKTVTFLVPRDSKQRVRYLLEARSGALKASSAVKERDIRYHAPEQAPHPPRVVNRPVSPKTTTQTTAKPRKPKKHKFTGPTITPSDTGKHKHIAPTVTPSDGK